MNAHKSWPAAELSEPFEDDIDQNADTRAFRTDSLLRPRPRRADPSLRRAESSTESAPAEGSKVQRRPGPPRPVSHGPRTAATSRPPLVSAPLRKASASGRAARRDPEESSAEETRVFRPPEELLEAARNKQRAREQARARGPSKSPVQRHRSVPPEDQATQVVSVSKELIYEARRTRAIAKEQRVQARKLESAPPPLPPSARPSAARASDSEAPQRLVPAEQGTHTAPLALKTTQKPENSGRMVLAFVVVAIVAALLGALGAQTAAQLF